ncbi:VOC family protein [Paenibacillus thalictri]|uniref:Glyoxalase n=1 Tax=Paenibacillus thalictri TaxID=2527873 RepID=A0A4Q9DSJ9_9BACL|nr:VOC family protein [Paenibacillus thalictri]TBL77865.1 glyoxalase [Paenibacillus thalictri]
MYEGIQHVSLAVTDLGQAKVFYGGVLGFKETPRPAFQSKGAWYDIGGTQLHLIENNGRTLRGTDIIDDKDGHFAVRVTRMRDVLDMLNKALVPYVDRPQNLTMWHQVYVTDPDGNVIEFNAARE